MHRRQAAGQAGPHRFANSRFATASFASILREGEHGPDQAIYKSMPEMSFDTKFRCGMATCVVRSSVARTCSNEDATVYSVHCTVLIQIADTALKNEKEVNSQTSTVSLRCPIASQSGMAAGSLLRICPRKAKQAHTKLISPANMHKHWHTQGCLLWTKSATSLEC